MTFTRNDKLTSTELNLMISAIILKAVFVFFIFRLLQFRAVTL